MTKSKVKKFSYFMLPSLVSALVPVVTLPIISRNISVEDYGIYALCIAFGTFLSGLANMGMTAGYERNFFEQKKQVEHGELLFSVVFFVFCSCILFGLFSFLLKDDLSNWIIGNRGFGNSLLLGYLAISTSALKHYFLLYYKNVGNAKSFAWYSIDEVVLNVLIGMFLVIYLDMGIDGLLIGQLAGASLVLIILLFRFLSALPVGFSRQLLKNCFAISLPLTPRIFFGVIGTQFDKYLISLLGSLGGVGLYNLGQKVSYVVFNYMTALQNIYSPKVYQMMFDQGDDADGKIGRYLTLPFYFSAFGGLGLALFSEEIILILTPSTYHGAIDIVSVLSLMYVLYFFGKQPQLIYAKKTSLTSLLTLVSIIINIAINIPLIKMYGGNGAAYGSLLAAFISSGISLWVAQKYFAIRWEWGKIGFCIISIFIFTLIHICLRETEMLWTIRVIIKILMIGLFIGGGFFFNIINIRVLQSYNFLKKLSH
ncbi:lipopolysaccharide biosynthesis protein [Aquirufa aurantiipilula]|uniref:Oligosaccharide flippase family protein n=1 Tax=Aquirufa aurantiipilula TaxID=2696561 RepID=A0ABT6BKB2_9BACT|nr:oligosaccharide flippase family protein [Aquirufa aurantiipilula]MDF5690837.1 oligosaccharide flippase family protein [Aquirufa aurantiipilula]